MSDAQPHTLDDRLSRAVDRINFYRKTDDVEFLRGALMDLRFILLTVDENTMISTAHSDSLDLMEACQKFIVQYTQMKDRKFAEGFLRINLEGLEGFLNVMKKHLPENLQ